MNSFKKMRSVRIPYKHQGLIYFTCLNYDSLAPELQEKVRNICYEVAGEYFYALFQVVKYGAVGALFSEVARTHCVDEGTLYKLRRKFYENFKIS